MNDTDIHLRLQALQFATDEAAPDESPEVTVARAEAFYNFLNGGNNGS